MVFIGELPTPILLIVVYQTRIAAPFVAITVVVAIILVNLPVFTLAPMGGGAFWDHR